MRAFMMLLVVVLAAPVALAQPRPGGPNPPVDRREIIKKKIRAMRAYTLTEELSLDDKTAAKLFPVLARYDDITDKLLVTRVDLTKQLRNAGTIADPRQVDKLIDEAVANQKAFWQLEEQRLGELRKILTPAQTARLVVVLPQFERRIQNQLRKAIAKPGGQGPGRNRPRMGAGRGPGAPDDDDDEEDTVDPFAGNRGPNQPVDPFAGNRGPNQPVDPFAGNRGPNQPIKPPPPSRAPGNTRPTTCDPFSSSVGCRR